VILSQRAVTAIKTSAMLLAVAAVIRAPYAPLSLGLALAVPPLVALGWRRIGSYLGAAWTGLALLLAALAFVCGASVYPESVPGLFAYVFALGVGTWAGWCFLSSDEKRGHARRKEMEDLELDLARLREEIGAHEKTFTVTENRRKRYRRMQEAVSALASTLEMERLAELTVQQIAQLLGGLSVDLTLFVLRHGGQEILRRTYSMNGGAPYPPEAKVQDDALNVWVLDKGASLVIKDLEKDFRFRGLDMARFLGRSFHLSPLLSSQGQVTGLMRIESANRESMDQEDQRLVESLVVLASMAFENARLYHEARELAVTDGLTRVLLRRSLMECLEVELKRAAEQGSPLSLIMLDIDHFKVVNDTYGHPAGDAGLREVAAMVKRSIRDVDVCGRYGGEEFVVLLPMTALEGALLVAERIRETVGARLFDLRGEPRRVTVSMGVATAPGHGARAMELITAADDALYQSKQNGRDRVTAAGGKA
jgi:diguanylate cyclase (GGDEF)-like protein